MKVYALNIENGISNIMFDILLSYVSNEKYEKIKRFVRRIDAERALIANLLSKAAIIENLKIQNKDISFYYNNYGKPFLNNYNNFHFNISHSGNWIVCAIDENSIGIDIEKIDNMNLDIARRFFSAKEHLDLLGKASNERQAYFFDLWTLKESYIKALGCGLSLPLDSFSIRIINGNIFLETENEFNKCFFKQYDIDANYKMSICSLNKTFPNDICFKSIEDILATLQL